MITCVEFLARKFYGISYYGHYSHKQHQLGHIN